MLIYAAKILTLLWVARTQTSNDQLLSMEDVTLASAIEHLCHLWTKLDWVVSKCDRCLHKI